ncbi:MULTISPECIES: diguanylate cyclase [unclassified Massilia]|uniref:tetratricopeptide repeat-containing diguanylate cyclase n=1 Tax=unclassified Massilia TaxID=2609279 RepID=UPI00177AA045|nr:MULTISPECIES: diguanylate cyclase [unclassified Massilia]MBD8529813.1 GGDEF domain-containing protein [Massilia sp. CFBP 13647]MBD8672175.1 GGDEF domain-containing protein [Massilia sp. CFBP 13721]
MPAARTFRQPRRRTATLLASLLLASSCAWGQTAAPLAERLAGIREINRFIPERALPMLLGVEHEARVATVADKGEMLAQLCVAYMGVGRLDKALATCDELIAFGRQANDNGALAKGLMSKGYIKYRQKELAVSHALIWEAERLALTTDDVELRVRVGVSSAESYAEDGNFFLALEKTQAVLTYARQHGGPVHLVMVLNSLARLYGQTREHDKGFEALAEATEAAGKTNSPGRMATLKATEYGLAVDTGQMPRALKAQTMALELQRQIGAQSLVVRSLVNLADCYLKMGDYRNAKSYSVQAIAAAGKINDEVALATARVNLGQAFLSTGNLTEGKRSFEAGLASYEKSGDKPELQTVLAEYGEALERAGDYAGAVQAYHRERTLSNELFERRRQKAMLELQEKYDADKKQRQIVLLERENEIKSVEIDNRRLQQRVWWLLAAVFALASLVVALLYRKVRHANAQLFLKNQELKQQSARDPLTNLYNRRHFQEFMRGDRMLERMGDQRGAGTTGEEMVSALFLLDVDHFKHINDTWGHSVGDAVLIRIAESLREILRETDMIVRWGGEEFLAFLPSIPKSGLDDVARRLLNGIGDTSIACQGTTLSVNVSIGFAPYPLAPAGQPLPWERAVNLVDMALYMAKGHGRNRAYGVRGFTNFGQTSMEEIEQNLEQAWRAGFVDMSIVTGGYPDLRASA